MRIVIIRHGQTMANVINDEGTALYTGNKGWNTNPKTGKRNRGR